jgi:hypothetical protein
LGEQENEQQGAERHAGTTHPVAAAFPWLPSSLLNTRAVM